MTARISASGTAMRMRASESGKLGEIVLQRGTLALAQRDGDVQLLQVLREHLAAELRLLLVEEAAHVRLERRRCEPGDAFGQAAHGVLRIEAIHGLPVRLHEVPGELTRIDAHEHAADDERSVL